MIGGNRKIARLDSVIQDLFRLIERRFLLPIFAGNLKGFIGSLFGMIACRLGLLSH